MLTPNGILLIAFNGTTGVLPTGRTIVGTLIDPLGIFSTSKLLVPDEYDHKVIEASVRLWELILKALRNSAVVELPRNVGVSELITVTQKISAKLWAKRGEALVVGSGFAFKLLDRTIQRMEVQEKTRTGAVR